MVRGKGRRRSRLVPAAGRSFVVLSAIFAVASANGCQGNVRGTPTGAEAGADAASADPDRAVSTAPDAGSALEPADGGSSAEGDGGSRPVRDAGTSPPPPPPPLCATATEAGVIALANDARAAADVGPLRCDDALGAVARTHSQDMCDRSYFDHVNLEGDSPFDRMTEAGVRYRTAGENIARGQPTPEDVHRSWMNSTGHRRNILDADYGRIGVGYVACGGARRHYWTQVFAD